MTYLTTAFYLIGGALCTGASLFMFGSYFKTKKRANLSLAFVFFWIGLHAFAFALPTVYNSSDLHLLGYGYIVGIGMIFLTMLSGIEVQAYMAKRIVTEKMMLLASAVLSVLGIITIYIMITDFHTPVINSQGIIFWNINRLAAWIIGLSSCVYGIIWGYVFYKAATLVDDVHSRVKLLVMSADGFLIGTVALLVHTSTNEVQTIVGHSMFVLSGILTFGIYLLPEKIFRFANKKS